MKRTMRGLLQPPALIERSHSGKEEERPVLCLFLAQQYERSVSFFHSRGRSLKFEGQMVDLSYLSRIHIES